jgi:hypothetical protein
MRCSQSFERYIKEEQGQQGAQQEEKDDWELDSEEDRKGDSDQNEVA